MHLIHRALNLSVFVILCGIYQPFAMARCDADEMRANLLKLTPLGSRLEAVTEAINGRGWSPRFAPNAGYLDEKTGKQIGVSSINALVAECHESALAVTSLTAYWAFDAQQRLVDIQVLKTVDAP